MDYPKAGFLRRLAALILDCILLEILGALATFPLQQQFDLDLDRIVNLLVMGGETERSAVLFLVCYTVLLTLLWGSYFTWFIGWSGQTPGKKALGIQVRLEDGSLPDYSTAFRRFIGYGISGGLLLGGFLWALVDPNKQALHDKMAHTMVVRTTL